MQFKEIPPDKVTAIEETEAIYAGVVNSLKEAYKRFSQEGELDIEEACLLIEKLVGNISLGNDKIIFLTTHNYSEDYLIYHIVNVSILSIRIGLHLKYPCDSLVNLGVLALLHGIGDPEEQGCGVHELEKQKFIQNFILCRKPRDSFIKDAFSIIAIIDVYESLTHSRAYRPSFMPYEILKAIISASEEVFNPEIAKEVIRVFSLYPLGSKVRLNTEEVAQVVRVNPDFPLRPQVVIMLDNYGNKLRFFKLVINKES